MTDEELEALLNVPYRLKQRTFAISADLRPARRLALLVLILNHCRAGRASLEQLHVLNWAIRTEQSRNDFLDFLKGKRYPDRAVVSYDPSLSRLIAFALAEKFVLKNDRPVQQPIQGIEPPAASNGSSSSVDYRIILSDRGKALVEALKKHRDMLVAERDFLKRIGMKVTQQQVHELLYWGLR
jgi:hypothetical protein